MHTSPPFHPWQHRLICQQQCLSSSASLVIDADVHLTGKACVPTALRARMEATDNYFHGRPMDADALLAEMDLAGISMALVWQNPSATAASGNQEENAASLAKANAAVADAADAHPARFIAAGWVDPRALGRTKNLELVRFCARELGLFVIKMNPAQNCYPMDCDEVVETVDEIVSEGAVPAFHFGADTPFTPPQALDVLAQRISPHPLIAVHGGGGGASYLEQERIAEDARALALRSPNIFVVHSSKRDAHIAADLLAFAGADAWSRLALGSDAPYGRMAWNFAGGRALLEQLSNPRHPETARRADFVGFPKSAVTDYLGGNAARFLCAAIERFLTFQQQKR